MQTDHWEEYLIPGTNILKNNLGIQDRNELIEKEKEITRKQMAAIYLKPLCSNFDIEDLKKIHYKIFHQIYPFAGKIRKCTLGKNLDVFNNPDVIERNLTAILQDLNNVPNIKSITEFAFYIAPFYHDVIMVHPFREGNGRTIRIFFREFVLNKSRNMDCGPLDIDYTKMDSENLLLGTKDRYIYPSMLEMEFMKAIIPKEKENNLKR